MRYNNIGSSTTEPEVSAVPMRSPQYKDKHTSTRGGEGTAWLWVAALVFVVGEQDGK